jgi:hypothetical protein
MTYPDVSIAIASAVTAYARIAISKKDILSKGGELYYSDTEVIVTNIPLFSTIVW